MIEPLAIWRCDVCDQPIDFVKSGYVIWKTDSNLSMHSIKIIHQTKCDLKDHSSSAPLEDFLGEKGLANLLSKLSLGPIKKSQGQKPVCQVVDMDEFVDFFRRVQTPFYEEARVKFGSPELMQDFDDSNELYPYLPEILKRIVAK
jgi:hypothetical protein